LHLIEIATKIDKKMGASTKFFIQNHSSRIKARPLTLKEVLRLRDGLKVSKCSGSNYPYPAQTFSTDKRILLALN
jgi:hypothetical protein